MSLPDKSDEMQNIEQKQKVEQKAVSHRVEIQNLLKETIVHEKNKEYEKVIKSYLLALEKFNEYCPNQYFDIVKTMNNLAGAYVNNNQLDMAIKTYLLAHENAVKNKIEESYFVVLAGNIGHCYKRLNDYGQSLLWFKKALPFYEKFHGKENKKTIILNKKIKYLEMAIQHSIQSKKKQ